MSIIIKDLSYTHTDKEVLFSNLNLIINSGEKTALTGNNGCGKSTLMRILAGEASPGTGSVHCSGHLYYVPQHFGQYDDRTVAQVLGIDRKLTALHAILNGDTAEEHFARLDNDWNIEERTQAVLHAWHLNGISLLRPLEGLSGGEKTRLFLAGMELKEPDTLLLDEPTNHLDMRSKDVLKEAIREFDGTVILVSHDRDFLDGLATKVYEFGGGLVKEHLGGIYEFLQKKKIDSLNELQKGAGLSASPTASAKGNEPETGQPSENKLSYEAQKELNKKIKKLERQVADCEASIEETESAIAIVEAKMATPEGASDMQLYERHQKLKQQLDGIVEEWERVSMELEEAKN